MLSLVLQNDVQSHLWKVDAGKIELTTFRFIFTGHS